MADRLPTLWKADPHTFAKHAILKRYLDAWFPIMTQQAAKLQRDFGTHQRREILFVDAFAGPGEYVDGEPGSPLIALRAAAHHSVDFPYPVRLAFTEKRPDRFRHLKELISRESENLPSNKNVLLDEPEMGECADLIDGLLARADERGVCFGPALVFLDQFGYSAVPLDLIRTILTFPSCETLTLLDFQGMNRWIERPGQEASFTRAFGGEEWRDCIPLEESKRKACLIEKYTAALKDRANAKYVYSFAMFDRNDRLLYRLIFCTGNLRGLEKMKEAMWSVDGTGECRFSDRNAIGSQRLLNAEFDQDWLATELLRRLAGETLTAAEIMEFVLVETPCHKFKTALMKLEADKESGVVITKAPLGRKRGFRDDLLNQIEVRFSKKSLF